MATRPIGPLPPRRALGLLLLSGIFAGLPVSGQERSLYWREIRVAAHLEASGALAISETWKMVFAGDGNGGERRFAVDWGQDLDFRGLTRIAPDGKEIPLVRGDLDRVDHYGWVNAVWMTHPTLRWRSRLPSDPPFAGTELTYRLEYAVRGVVHPTAAGKYRLDYDFLVPERAGTVERFALDLTLDPVWQPEEILPAHIEARDLAPGPDFRVPLALSYRGAGTPAAVPMPPSRRILGTLWGLTLLAILALLLRLARRERRLAAPPPRQLPRWLPVALFGAGLAGFAWEIARYRRVSLLLLLVALLVGAILYPLAAWAARRWRDRTQRRLPASLLFLLPSAAAVGLALKLAFPPAGSPLLSGWGGASGLPLWTMAFVGSVTHWAMRRGAMAQVGEIRSR